jgi:hypothetical protein
MVANKMELKLELNFSKELLHPMHLYLNIEAFINNISINFNDNNYGWFRKEDAKFDASKISIITK